MAAAHALEIERGEAVTVAVPPGRRRLPWIGVLFTVLGAVLLAGAVALLVASRLEPGTLEAAAVLMLTAASLCGALGSVGLRVSPRGRVTVLHRDGALVFPVVAGGTRAWGRAAWVGLLCPLPLLHARLAGVPIEGGMLTLGLWLGALLGVLALAGKATSGGPTTVPVYARLHPDEVAFATDRTVVTQGWDELTPLSRGRHPVRDVLAPSEDAVVADGLASDPDAVARLVEHYRTHPEHRAELGGPDVIALLPERAAIVPPR